MPHTNLFKGKRRDNQEWVHGGIIEDSYILQYIDLVESWTPLSSDHKVTCRAYEVHPETICRMTPLRDRYNNDIYEYDILKFVGGTCDVLSCGVYSTDVYEKGQHLVVNYLKSGYTLRRPDLMNENIENLVGNVGQYGFWNHQRSLLKVGNIFDNPELLNG